MNLRDWNRFFWQVIEERLYKPGARLYLAFDESLLEEELERAGIQVPSGGPTHALNAAIQRHCRPMRNGFIGLSAEPGGRCRKDNWQWVFGPDEMGRTLALTFVVQQILAAEHMRGVSYYTAYWQMLGATADETRINPFGDQGTNSFTRLWGQLRKELGETLGVEFREITFEFGRGSNKYRNLPVSQSLLSEGDMALAEDAISGAISMDDHRLYAALRRTKLSSSGQRKVYISALKDSIVAQFREYLESERADRQAGSKRTAVTHKAPADVSTLRIYEDFELFGDSVFHLTTTVDGVVVAEVLTSFLSENKCLVFEESDEQISPVGSMVLRTGGTQVFILGYCADIDEMLSAVPDDASIPTLNEYFVPVSTSLAARFALIRCPSLPAALENVDISSEPPERRESAEHGPLDVQLGGGLCVNKASNAYILGFGPEKILRDGEPVEHESSCKLDSEEMPVGSALEKLSKSSVSCRFELCIAGKSVYIDMVEGTTKEPDAAYVLTDYCLLPIGLMDDRPLKTWTPIVFACDVNRSEWPEQRRKRIQCLAAAMIGYDLRWIKADQPSFEECLATMSYLGLPSSVLGQVERRMKATGLKPWPLHHRLELD